MLRGTGNNSSFGVWVEKVKLDLELQSGLNEKNDEEGKQLLMGCSGNELLRVRLLNVIFQYVSIMTSP